jgi:hypothetical protein
MADTKISALSEGSSVLARTDVLPFADLSAGSTKKTTVVGIHALGVNWINVKAYGATGDGATDDRAAIQAAIDAVPATGGTVYFPVGKYVVGSPGLDITTRQGLTFLGDYATSFNESGTLGAQLYAGANSITLVNGVNSSLVHQGHQFRSINFYSNNKTGVTLVSLKDVNHWIFDNCNFHLSSGSTSSVCLTLDMANDNAYGLLQHVTWTTDVSSTALNVVSSNGFTAIANNFSCTGTGTLITLGNDCAFYDCKWNFDPGADGAHVTVQDGGGNRFIGCSFEDHAGTNYCVLVNHPSTGFHPARTMFIGCYSTANKFIKIGSNANLTLLVACLSTGSPGDVNDAGHATIQLLGADSSGAQIVQTGSASKVGFFGTTAITRPTVTGSRGGNAALASLATALDSLGLITNSTSA